MQQSVPTASVAQATFCATLFDEFISQGLRDVVICPGSRSTPLALAAADRSELTIHVRIDERSAAFYALGVALATKRPVAIVVTSGTAAAELHAAVAEADQAFVPLLVLTADRPPELHGVGAPQTINQHQLFGSMVRAFYEPGVADYAKRDSWRQLAREIYDSAFLNTGGPVQANLAFVEPLVASPLELPGPIALQTKKADESYVAERTEAKRVLCIVGPTEPEVNVDELLDRGWAVIGDVTTQGTIAYFDTLLRSDQFVEAARPDLILRFGGLPASKVLQERLRNWGVPIWGCGDRFVSDPDRLIKKHCALPPEGSAVDPSYLALWTTASNKVHEWLTLSINPTTPLSEPVSARRVTIAANANNASLVVGSSMPVRDVEWWAPTRTAPTFCNRGVNGIDGVVSTVLGVGQYGPVLGYVGDVTFLHDVSGLVDGVGDASFPTVLVVSDNRGGGIFNFLSQATQLSTSTFEQLFGTPHRHDLAQIARGFGHRAVDVTTVGELDDAITQGLKEKGLTVVVAHVPTREVNVALHDQWNKEVTDLIEVLL